MLIFFLDKVKIYGTADGSEILTFFAGASDGFDMGYIKPNYISTGVARFLPSTVAMFSC